MTAAQQVFDIAELREIIICQVDAHQISELKLVDRSWRDTISSSKAVRRARVVNSFHNNDWQFSRDPVKMSQEELDEVFNEALSWFNIITATYSWIDWIRVNPVLVKVHSEQFKRFLLLTIRLPQSADFVNRENMDEFVTSPPCQHISLKRMIWLEKEWGITEQAIACSVYRKEGVRVSDVLAVRDQLLAGQRDDEEILASLKVYTQYPAPESAAEERIRKMYAAGPLPRYRKATHLLDRKGVAIYRKDEELEWEPEIDRVSNE